MADPGGAPVSFTLNGDPVVVGDGVSLLDALREELGCRSLKDGCSPQGQCGCCTVWVDGLPRVACVTPVRRVAGRSVTTLEGLATEQRDRWADAFVARGASQCGFCTPGIVMRLAALGESGGAGEPSRRDVEAALRAHLCRCTGWQSIVEAACDVLGAGDPPPGGDGCRRRSRRRPRPALGVLAGPDRGPGLPVLGARRRPRRRRLRRRHRAARRAGPARRRRRPRPVRARRRRAGRGRIQGRNSTVPLSHPVELPAGAWALTLQTTWVEPAYVEPDASWCRPGRAPGLAARQRRGLRRQAAQPRARRAPGSWPTRRAGPSGCCGGARTWCGTGPSARRSPSACAPTAAAPSASAGRRVGRPRLRWLARAARAAAPGSRSRRSRCAGRPWRPTCAAPAGRRCWRRSTPWRRSRARRARAGPR